MGTRECENNVLWSEGKPDIGVGGMREVRDDASGVGCGIVGDGSVRFCVQADAA